MEEKSTYVPAQAQQQAADELSSLVEKLIEVTQKSNDLLEKILKAMGGIFKVQ